MKDTILSIILIFGFTAAASAQETTANFYMNRLGVRTEYDRFKDQTAVQLSESLMPDRYGFVLFEVLAVVKGQETKGARPALASIVIRSVTDRRYFLNTSNHLRVIQDGERYDLGDMKIIKSEVRLTGVMEALMVVVPIATIEKLANAQKIDIQVGVYEAAIPATSIAHMKDWLAQFKP